MESFITHVATLSPLLMYGGIFIGFMLEANTVLFSTMFLAEQHALNLWILLPVALIGSMAGNILFYGIGYAAAYKSNRYTRITDIISKPFDHHLHERPWRTIFLTKFVYGLNCAIIVRAGQIRMTFGKFLFIDSVCTLIWLVIVGSLGYGSGSFVSITAQELKHAEIGLLVALIIFFGIKHFISTYIKKELKD
ncbi:MAG: hypothetical protein RLY66_206 [Candidatus Parcubacteria bacterium]|jgi:membrane protein DedA with SNARE-associated domain